MGFLKSSWMTFQYFVFFVLCLKAFCNGSESEVSVRFLKTPHEFSNSNSAAFVFQVLMGRNGGICTNCTTTCKLDDGISSNCNGGEVSYTKLQDGIHKFEVCTNQSHGFSCPTYNWTVDTIPPTAHVIAATSFTNALNVSINISFSEPCYGRHDSGGFDCSSVNTCNLLVYGDAQVAPDTLIVLQSNLKFSLLVKLSSSVQYGRVVIVMDTSFCTDAAGNKFTRTKNSSFIVHFDRRRVFVNLRTHVPEKQLQLNSQTRTVLATNEYTNLKVYLYFTEPILNSSAEILNSLKTSQGFLLPTKGSSHGNRRFGFQVENISTMATVTLTIASNLVISRQGMPVSPTAPITFLYDSERPAVKLSAAHMRTRESIIPIWIKFIKPVFGLNASHISILGGHLQSLYEINRRTYVVYIQASDEIVSVSVPENMTVDVAGNKNLASNILKVRYYTEPVISLSLSIFTTAAFAITSFVAGLLTVSTASLQSVVALSSPPFLRSDPTRNLFRIACHIQIFALTRWLSVNLPLEYYEFANGLQWTIPYIHIPWEIEPFIMGSISPSNPHTSSSKFYDSGIFRSIQPVKNLDMTASVYGLPLTPVEYQSFFESRSIIPEVEYILDQHTAKGWRKFDRSMFWLAVIGGSLILLHALVIFILKFWKKNSDKQKSYGALVFPRFEIFLMILALPCVCKASVAVIKGGSASGNIFGILLLGVVSFLLLALVLFLSIGITFGRLLQYKEVHREGQVFRWYQDVVRVTLGPGKRGQWTWRGKANSVALNMFGPLFEDLRGPPKYMLSQISGGNLHKHTDRIIASDDETEDAEAPFIQKLFGILRIYFTLIEFVRRTCLGIMAGLFTENRPSKTPTITLLCITSFELFFMLLKKPFIKKKVQLVEIISLSVEVGIFATCLVILEREFSTVDETKIGIFMLSLFLFAFLAQMVNEWYALYRQTKQMDPDGESFLSGLKMASIGFLLFFFPQRLVQKLASKFPLDSHNNKPGRGEAGEPTSSSDRNRSSGSGSRSSGDKPWLKQLRELAQSSFGREKKGAVPNDPSSSTLSGFWSGKRSDSSSAAIPSADFRSKSKGLYKDLETIFASE